MLTRLEALKKQLGPSAWSHRVAEARAKEKVVRSLLRLKRQGIPVSRAHAALSVEVSLATLLRWAQRYEAHGRDGLIDQRGGVGTQNLKAYGNERRGTGTETRRRKPVSFIKWAGSKNSMLSILRAAMPESFGTYYEPMVGSGVLFSTVGPPRAVLGDANPELMNCYEVVRHHVEELIAALGRHRNTSEHYYRVRARVPERLDPVSRAARTIYLSKTCFNGLYRLNQKGTFNVPYGNRRDAIFCDAETLRSWSAVLKRVRLVCGDYPTTVARARRGDFIYFDPPYFLAPSKLAQSARYARQPFDAQEHERLRDTFATLDARGCYVMLSNSDAPEVRALYRDYTIRSVKIRRVIAASASRRDDWRELVICNYALPKQLQS